MLLFKTLRSSTLKLAFIYVTGFSSAIFAVLGYVYWSTIVYVTERSDRTIAAEHAALGKAYDAAGRNGLTAVIDRRLEDRFFDDWVYLLADPALGRVAGNLPQWPASLRRGGGWADFDATVKDRHPGKATPLRASYRTLPDGFHLLVGRKADDLGHFRKMMAIGLGWAGGLFLLLAAAAGISTSRRTVARIEAINTTGRRIIEAGLHQRIPLRGTRDEWDELAQNLNAMLDRIEELVEFEPAGFRQCGARSADAVDADARPPGARPPPAARSNAIPGADRRRRTRAGCDPADLCRAAADRSDRGAGPTPPAFAASTFARSPARWSTCSIRPPKRTR